MRGIGKIKVDISLFNLFYIFVCIIWPPLQLFILGVDGAGRSIVLLSVLAIFLNLPEFGKHKEAFYTPAFICWALLIVYSLINALAHGSTSEFGRFSFLKENFFSPFIFLVIAMQELHRNRIKALKVIWWALGVFLLIGIPFITLSQQNRFVVLGLGNFFSLQAVAFLFVSAILLVEKRIRTLPFIGLALIASVIILFSGTRKAFGAEVIILSGLVLSLGTNKGPVSVLKAIIFGALLLVGINYALHNSVVGKRIDETIAVEGVVEGGSFVVGKIPPSEAQLVEDQHVNDILVGLLDDRAIQYELGLALFRMDFWTGIGIGNFTEVSGFPYRLHTEYIVQLCENGIIGFVLLILFYVFIYSALRKNKTDENARIMIMAFFGLLAILFINFTAWTYCTSYAMIVYAIVLNYAYSKPTAFQLSTRVYLKNEK